MSSSGDWAGITVAVTGACGGYGAFLTRSLVKAGAHVRALDLRRDDHLGFLAEAEASGKATFSHCDLCAADVTSLRDALKGVKVIFHTVAYFGDPPFAMKQFANPGNEEKMQATNVSCVVRLLEVARDEGVQAFVHTSSTNTLFSGREELVDATETTPYPKPSECIDLYSVTKAEAEQLVIGSDGEGGLRTASVRPNGIYGPSMRCYGISKLLIQLAPIGIYPVKILDFNFKEPLVDWCHVDNLALVQMLAAKQLLAQNPAVCGSIYHASDDVVSTPTVFFGEFLSRMGWPILPMFPVPAHILQPLAYGMEATCWALRKLTGSRSITAPLTAVEAAKSTLSNYQNIEKAKRELGYVAIPQSQLMDGMGEFARSWYREHVAIPAVPRPLGVAILFGMAVTLFLSCADVQLLDGMPWQILRTVCSTAVPSMAHLSLEAFQRKVLLVGICMPMVALHVGDALVAAYLARRISHVCWMQYGLRTVLFGYGQLRHLLPKSAAPWYVGVVALAFSASAAAAARMS